MHVLTFLFIKYSVGIRHFRTINKEFHFQHFSLALKKRTLQVQLVQSCNVHIAKKTYDEL
ncbi:hypothetical protein T4D_15804 [Trichinella pseudospiralis]|uniref:Uncharacterized protein n=1 Tax=Trichinella pseudospiralis TaxID=6337 RepID=A0A0V1FGU4_TRIPS|nr:hypothetical protein T4D_15804 [Trichinella pseudospiralis]